MAGASNLLMRLMFSAIFMAGGLLKILSAHGDGKLFTKDVNMAAAGFERMGLEPMLSSVGVLSLLPTIVYSLAVLQVSGALAVLTGGYRCGAWMLLVFLALVTPVAHWPLDAAGQLDMPQLVQLGKNAAIAGGLLLCAATDGGKDVVLPGGKQKLQ